MAFNDGKNVGLFVPTTNIWDVGLLHEVDVNSPQFKELLIRLYQNINTIAIALNLKDSGYYITSEFVNGQLYFQNPALNSLSTTQPQFRQVFRTVVNFGALPNAGTTSVAHNIPVNAAYSFTRIYGCSSDQTGGSYIPLPYASPTDADNIELNVDTTNVNITTGSNRTNYTVTYVVIEYIKN